MIPARFTLAGNEWSVHYKPKKRMQGCYGQCHESTNEIWIYSRLGDKKRLQTFIHEAAHAILFTMGHLEHDEVLVEGLSQLVYQLFITGEYDDNTETMGAEQPQSTSDD